MKLHKRLLTLVLLIFLLSLGFAAQAQDTTISFLAPPWGVPPSEDALNAFMDESGIHGRDSIGANGRSLQPRPGVRRSRRSARRRDLHHRRRSLHVVATGNMLPLNELLEMGDLDADDFESLDFWTLTAMSLPCRLSATGDDGLQQRQPGGSRLRLATTTWPNWTRWPKPSVTPASMTTPSPLAPSTGHGG